MAGASVTQTAELLGFRELPYQRPYRIQEARTKPPASEVIPAGLLNLPTEPDVQ